MTLQTSYMEPMRIDTDWLMDLNCRREYWQPMNPLLEDALLTDLVSNHHVTNRRSLYVSFSFR
jgi:hypothetical protein